jgi:hypothetical protein
MQSDRHSSLHQFKSFTKFYKHLESYVHSGETETTSSTLDYASYFTLHFTKDKLGARTKLYIPKSHYQGYNLWVIKAIDLNRGRCIKVAKDIENITLIIKKFHKGLEKTVNEDDEQGQGGSPKIKSVEKKLGDPGKYSASIVVLQKYIENPMLYHGRKFDIRLWVLLSHKMDIYVFK